MDKWNIWDSEYRFMMIVWDAAPVGSGKLVELCKGKLGWKKSTTYNAIRRMCDKGLIMNKNATVEVIVPKEDVQAMETNAFMEHAFEGSLPQFLTSFLNGKTISDKEAEKIKHLIDAHKEK